MRKRPLLRQQKFTRKFFPNRLLAAQAGALILFGIILFRLFELQIVNGEEYYDRAVAQRSSYLEIPAQRGEIFVRDENEKLIKLATNTTLDLVYIDPKVTPNKRLVAETLAPLLYDDEDYAACLDNPKLCPRGSVHIEEVIRGEGEDQRTTSKVRFPTRIEAEKAYVETIYRKINVEKVEFLALKNDVPDETLDILKKSNIPGIEILRDKSLVGINPTRVPQDKKTISRISQQLEKILEIDPEIIQSKLHERDVRYVKIKNKIRPETSEKIQEFKDISKESHDSSRAEIAATKSDRDSIPDYFRGIVLVPEHWRYYPDKALASHILGFVNRENQGQYGIEGKFNRLLAGKKGIIEGQNDVRGKNVTPRTVRGAQNGQDIILTIDRVVQRKVEEVLAEATKKFRADSGQILVIEPKTGKILAMANYPSFDPNRFIDALEMRRTTPEDAKEIFATTPLFVKDELGRYSRSTFEEFDEAWRLGFDPEFYIFKNRLGEGAFINRMVQEIYEPGSVFKPLVMSAALETGEVTPETTYHEDGPLEVGNFTIHTALGEYRGLQTMTNVLETSSNIGMANVALRLGKSVMHSFIVKKFGFGDYTDINLDQEEPGKVFPKKDWSDAHLLTASFGQGLTVTPLQMIRAWTALSNNGVMMQPYIVEEIHSPYGKKEVKEVRALRRILSPDTAVTITSMLISGVDNGVAWPAGIKGYAVAGKTGTSQIAGSDGKYETGEGAFITSFMGYAPAYDPEFLILVKFDRPRLGVDNTWGSTTAAPVFRQVMEFLLDYRNIEPTRINAKK